MKKTILLFVLPFIMATVQNNVNAQTYPEMITVAGGTFTMGDSDGEGEANEQPVHNVTLKTFKIAKTETTVAQWRAYCNATGRAMPESYIGTG